MGQHTFCDDHFPRILAATSPASVTIDGVVKLRMEEEGMGARSPISCYSTIRFDDGDYDDDVYNNDGGGEMGTRSPISCYSTIRSSSGW